VRTGLATPRTLRSSASGGDALDANDNNLSHRIQGPSFGDLYSKEEDSPCHVGSGKVGNTAAPAVVYAYPWEVKRGGRGGRSTGTLWLRPPDRENSYPECVRLDPHTPRWVKRWVPEVQVAGSGFVWFCIAMPRCAHLIHSDCIPRGRTNCKRT
jgi:hypothetical protein